VIIVKLQGGLGNQMFQYAAGKSLAQKKSTLIVLDLEWYKQNFGPESTARTYELSCFDLHCFTRCVKSKLASLAVSFSATDYKEPHFHFDPGFFHLPRHAVLNGYFQSDKYFKDIRDILLKEFAWKNEPQGKNLSLFEEIRQTPGSISLHIRRCDYMTNENVAKVHGITEMSYYEAGVKAMAQKINNPKFYIFSDEPEWCRQNLKLNHPAEYISNHGRGSEDMRLMKECRHHIIANSSFSWWGAWLNENPDKLVITPKKWFSCQEKNTKDLIPASWHKL
jgi:hypothetical protein